MQTVHVEDIVLLDAFVDPCMPSGLILAVFQVRLEIESVVVSRAIKFCVQFTKGKVVLQVQVTLALVMSLQMFLSPYKKNLVTFQGKPIMRLL